MGSLVTLSVLMTVIGAIPGVLLIISGVFLMRSAKAAAEAEGNLTGSAGESMLENYGTFIKMQLFYQDSNDTGCCIKQLHFYKCPVIFKHAFASAAG
ncbi:hypothetical protein [Bacillus subtilis]|uniref:hypothetical protein n=1 Tax=Bacillus subtilis TaxID=1423 RepID=UPI003D6B656C